MGKKNSKSIKTKKTKKMENGKGGNQCIDTDYCTDSDRDESHDFDLLRHCKKARANGRKVSIQIKRDDNEKGNGTKEKIKKKGRGHEQVLKRKNYKIKQKKSKKIKMKFQIVDE